MKKKEEIRAVVTGKVMTGNLAICILTALLIIALIIVMIFAPYVTYRFQEGTDLAIHQIKTMDFLRFKYPINFKPLSEANVKDGMDIFYNGFLIKALGIHMGTYAGSVFQFFVPLTFIAWIISTVFLIGLIVYCLTRMGDNKGLMVGLSVFVILSCLFYSFPLFYNHLSIIHGEVKTSFNITISLAMIITNLSVWIICIILHFVFLRHTANFYTDAYKLDAIESRYGDINKVGVKYEEYLEAKRSKKLAKKVDLEEAKSLTNLQEEKPIENSAETPVEEVKESEPGEVVETPNETTEKVED